MLTLLTIKKMSAYSKVIGDLSACYQRHQNIYEKILYEQIYYYFNTIFSKYYVDLGKDTVRSTAYSTH